ncbi:MAG: TraB/GumN family protein, partial [Pseudohongiellaceae bacterium]
MFNRRLGACLALVTLLVITGPAYAQTDRQPLWAQVEAPLAEDNPALITIAQAGTAEPPALQCKDPSSSMLWKVEGNDRDVYLFGSIHVGKADFYPLHDDIEQAFREAEHLVFEVDPQSASDTSVVLQMQSRGMLPAGQTLSDVVSGEVLQQLRVVLAELGMPEAGFMTMRPWFLTLVLSSFQMAMSGFEPRYGIENYLASRQTPDMEILELESIGEQISFLEELNAESFLAYTLEGFDEGQEEIESLISAWRCADKETLFNTLFS